MAAGGDVVKRPHPVMRQLTELRREQGLTQAALARRLFVGTNAISQRETGRNTASLAEADRHAQALGYRIGLIPLDPDPAPEGTP